MASDTLNWLKWFSGGCGAVLSLIFGPLDGAVFGLISVCVIDYITGVCLGAVHHKLSSEVGFKGIIKKAVIFAVVCIGHLIDTVIIKDGTVFRSAIIFFYFGNESLSILENAVALGLPVPNKLKAILKQLKEEKFHGDNEGD